MKVIYVVLILASVTLMAVGQSAIYETSHYRVFPDHVEEGVYAAKVLPGGSIESTYPTARGYANGRALWSAQTDVSQYPQIKSEYPLIDALYTLSLDELRADVRTDWTFMAGAAWDGVWTRDISYSILLSLAAIEPEVAKRSLLAKVKRGRIMQDTGTGGSWPVSSDRTIWAVAAWEIYKVTGDREWLRHSYEIVRQSTADDEKVLAATDTGLMRGESTFMDWREQTYPMWMTPVDIYQSQTLGTNAVHCQTFRILSEMTKELGLPSAHYRQVADRIRTSMNRTLWQERTGYYGQYLYGRQHPALSPRSDALGEASTALFNIAGPEKQNRIFQSVPVMEYGIPCIYPQTDGIPAYHNNAVWPFVQAYWGWAGAKSQQEAIVLGSIASIYRAAALFLTNKENFVARTGSNAGTEINSDRQLWSVAGNLAVVYRMLFGMEFGTDGISIHPVVPAQLDGQYTLSNFRYRKALLTVRLHGHGSRITSCRIDGHAAKPIIPTNLSGPHEIEIELRGEEDTQVKQDRVVPSTAPATPQAVYVDGRIMWSTVPRATEYRIYRDGKLIGSTRELQFAVRGGAVGEYQVTAQDSEGRESFLSEPIPVNVETYRVLIEGSATETGAVAKRISDTEKALHDRAAAGVMLSRDNQMILNVPVSLPAKGVFDLQFHYANGNGPINTENKCALRTLYVDRRRAGTIVMPQRGTNLWTNYGLSSSVRLSLEKGRHLIELRLEPEDENMNLDVNQAQVDAVYFERYDQNAH